MTMASVPHSARQAGYATAAAAMISLGLAVGASAAVTLGLSQLKTARAQLRSDQRAAAFDGVQTLAAFTIMRSANDGRLSWSIDTLDQRFTVLAEREADKLNVTAANAASAIAQIGAVDTAAVLDWLQQQHASPAPAPIAEADSAALWRACAPSLLSYYGQSDQAKLAPAQAPDQSGDKPRVGQVWRIAAQSGGWTDDRLVRLTGNPVRPMQTIQRHLHRTEADDCPMLVGP